MDAIARLGNRKYVIEYDPGRSLPFLVRILRPGMFSFDMLPPATTRDKAAFGKDLDDAVSRILDESGGHTLRRPFRRN